MKFGRKCTLSMEVAGDKNLDIPQEMTIEFNIQRNSLASSQTATFKIENLAEETRNLIYRDRYANIYRAIQFRAGYESFTPLVFNGFIFQAYSYKEGGSSTFITQIECYDGALAMANGFTSTTIAAGESAAKIINTLTADLPRVQGSPIIGDFPKTNSRGVVLCGNTWDLIQQQCGGQANIDNNQVKVLNTNEVFQGEIPVINAETGLLGSPRRYDAILEFEMLFEPRLSVGQTLELQSSTNKLFNGVYKVMGFEHRGTISPTKGGECISKVTLWLGTQVLNVITGSTVQ